MINAVPVTINLLANSVVPFWFALLIVLAVARLFRIPPSPWRIGLLLIPVGQLLWNVLRGIPEGSFLWAHSSGIVRGSGALMIGAGASGWGGFKFQFLMQAFAGGESYGLSIGDLIVLGCDRQGTWCGPALVGFLLGTAFCLLLRRALRAYRFERQRRRDRQTAITSGRYRLWWRWVDVYVAPAKSASTPAVPFTGGVFRPYICFPLESFFAMDADERQAVLQHELAHVRHFHALLLGAATIIEALFWYVPGCGWLLRKVATTCEEVADESALNHGARRLALASALVRIGETLLRHPVSVTAVQPLASGSSPCRLAYRTRRLIGEAHLKPPRFGWRFGVVRLAVFYVAAQMVLMSVWFNNL
jgi:Zn-dependent protease with chaperone function